LTQQNISNLRERIDDSLFYVDVWGAGEAWYIVDKIFTAVYRALRRAPDFTDLSHDHFDALTADVRERAYQELGEQIEGLCDLADVERAIDRGFQFKTGDAPPWP
jgi:hypothetical protein